MFVVETSTGDRKQHVGVEPPEGKMRPRHQLVITPVPSSHTLGCCQKNKRQHAARWGLSGLCLVLVSLWFLSLGFASTHLPAPPSAPSQCFLQTKYVKKGKWRTLEKFWNAKGTAFFKAPKGAKIKVRYGKWFGKNRQKRTLNGVDYKKLSVGGWSLSYARMQIKVAKHTEVTYVICPGGVALKSPPIRF